MDGEEARPSAQTRFGGVCGFLQEQLPGGSVVATILFAWFGGCLDLSSVRPGVFSIIRPHPKSLLGADLGLGLQQGAQA